MKAWLPPLLWAVIILAISSIPQLSVPTLGLKSLDKAAHFTEYLILGLLLRKAFLSSAKLRSRSLILAGGLVVLIALLDELHQLLIPGRFCDLVDLFADWTGGVLGVFIFAILRSRST